MHERERRTEGNRHNSRKGGFGTLQYFPAASWPTSLKAVSALGAAVLLGAGYGAWMAIPPYGFPHVLISLVACVPPAIGVIAALFTVTGYETDLHMLYIRRLLWTTAVDLDGLKQVRHDPDATKSSVRIFGNGGLFSFTGIYQNERLGTYRLFATDGKYSVVLVLPGRVVVVTPADPQAFVQHMQLSFAITDPPHTKGGA